MPVAPARASTLPIALALLGIAFLVAALALVVVTQTGGSRSTPSASATLVAAASPTPTALPTPTPVPTPVPTVSAGSLASGTPEPSPAGVWTPFNSPDGKWSASFPSTSAPIKTTTTSGSGTYAITETVFSVTDLSGARYAVDYSDLTPAFVAGMTADDLMVAVETSIATQGSATVVRSESTTWAGHAARDSVMLAQGQVLNLRMSLVATRLYILMTASKIGTPVYPQHFFAAFKFK